MHIYAWQMELPSQLSIDALNTATPNLADLADIAQCTYMHGRLTPQSIEHRCLEYHYTKLSRSSRYSTMHIYAWQIWPTKSIEHRCLEYCYTKLGRSSRYSTMHIYTWQIYPPSQLSIDALNTATPNLAGLADIAQCTYMHDRSTPQSIEHRCLEYHCYTKLGRSSTMHKYAWQIYLPSQSSIDALNTTTPNLAALADIALCTYMHGRLTPQSIEHTCLKYRYTKLGRSTPENFYIRKTFYPWG